MYPTTLRQISAKKTSFFLGLKQVKLLVLTGSKKIVSQQVSRTSVLGPTMSGIMVFHTNNLVPGMSLALGGVTIPPHVVNTCIATRDASGPHPPIVVCSIQPSDPDPYLLVFCSSEEETAKVISIMTKGCGKIRVDHGSASVPRKAKR